MKNKHQSPEENPDHFDVMRKINNMPGVSQRKLATELGFSLGKLNYCVKSLKDKGLLKISNFKKNKNKINYIYILTPQGLALKTKLTINFMKRKMHEYDELKNELENK
mgnify:FL=1|tara:strand:- start:2572 stop:2895 length:324 start_codon:yes stop_codon:yes gene_type:complete